jgi:hypothetical protein
MYTAHMLFEKKLGIDSSKKRWIGLKIGTVSGLAAFFGAFAMWLGAVELGRAIVVIGIAGGFIGIAFTFYALVKVRFGLRPETDNDDW